MAMSSPMRGLWSGAMSAYGTEQPAIVLGLAACRDPQDKLLAETRS